MAAPSIIFSSFPPCQGFRLSAPSSAQSPPCVRVCVRRMSARHPGDVLRPRRTSALCPRSAREGATVSSICPRKLENRGFAAFLRVRLVCARNCEVSANVRLVPAVHPHDKIRFSPTARLTYAQRPPRKIKYSPNARRTCAICPPNVFVFFFNQKSRFKLTTERTRTVRGMSAQ